MSLAECVYTGRCGFTPTAYCLYHLVVILSPRANSLNFIADDFIPIALIFISIVDGLTQLLVAGADLGLSRGGADFQKFFENFDDLFY